MNMTMGSDQDNLDNAYKIVIQDFINETDNIEKFVVISDEYSEEIKNKLQNFHEYNQSSNSLSLPPIEDYSGRLVVNTLILTSGQSMVLRLWNIWSSNLKISFKLISLTNS